MTLIHATAIVDPGAKLGADVRIAPFAIVGEGVEIGDGTTIASHAVIEKNTTLGAGCSVGIGSVLGGDPQDLKYRGEETWLTVGAGTRIREHVTINRGTAASGITTVGRECYLLSYVHIAHDCEIQDQAVIANSVQLGGHVVVGNNAMIGGLTPVHQFVKIGQYAIVGGGSRVPMDVPPFGKAAGNPLRLVGPNMIGLERAGFAPEVRNAIKKAYRIIFNSSERLAEVLAELDSCRVSEVKALVEFVRSSERGITR